MKHIFSSHYWRNLGLSSRWAALLLAAPLAASAANPTLTIVGAGPINADVTAFVDKVEIVRVSDGAVMAGAVANFSFETHGALSQGNYGGNPSGASWTFANNFSGIANNGSNFGAPTAPDGIAVAYVQNVFGTAGQLQQTLNLADGVYQVRFQTVQRTCCSSGDQRLNVLINGTQVGTVLPTNTAAFTSFTSNTFVVGSPNNALAFNGVNNQVNVASSASLNNIPTAITVEAWFRTGVTGERYITTKGDDSFYLAMQGGGGLPGVVSWYVNGPSGPSGGWLYGTTNLADNLWHHVAGTYDGATLRLYVDGALQNSRAATGAIPTGGTHSLDLGARTGASFWNGSLDNMRVYNTALSAAQVQADMFSATPVAAGVVASYNFDQGTAGGNNAGLTTLNDQSGNGNFGTLTNFALSGTSSNWVRSFPTITSLTPTSGPRGSSVLIAGTNLMDATSFKFNGAAVSPFTTPTDDFSATVTVPATATTGVVSTASAALTAYNGPVFSIVTDLVVSTGTAAAPTSIPAGTYNSIIVTGTGYGKLAGDVVVNSALLIQSGGALADGCNLITGTGTFTLAAGGTLSICRPRGILAVGDPQGNIGLVRVTGGRSFASDASYIYAGSDATGSGLPSQVRNLSITVPGDVALSQPTSITQALTLSSTGNLVLGSNALTLLSSASGTAVVVNSGTGVVSGSATVQRYIDPTLNTGLGYHHYSTPVSNTTVADLAAPGFAPEVSQAATYNASATPGTTSPFPTVFGYDQSRVTLTNNYAPFDRGYVVPASLGMALAVGRGYAVNLPGTALVDFTGTLTTGDQTPLALSRVAGNTDAGWQLLGNPYPAPLDYSLVAPADRTNLDAAIYVYSSTGQYVGQYRSYVNGVGGNSVMPVGQGFFARVSAGQTSGSLTFRNSQRLITPNATAFQRTAADSRPLVQLDLRGATGSADALYAYVQAGATPTFDSQFDAEKIANSTGLNLSSTATSGQRLAIDGRPVFDAATVLALNVGVPAAGTYTLAAVALNNLPVGLDAYLNDAQTGQTVNLRTQPAYSFSVSATQATALLAGRFSLRFTASALATAPALTAAQVALYPNPAHARFAVLMPGVLGATTVQAELVNALGQVVRRQSAALPASGATLTVETAELAAGVYTLRLLAGPTTLAKRVVIQ